MHKKEVNWIIALCIILALASFASAQLSNMNCDMYPTGSPPSPDYVDIIRSYGNDSHTQLASLNDYPYTFGCNSTIATIANSCAGNNMTVAELFKSNDSHVSIDGFYGSFNPVCLNTATPSRGWFRTITLTGATPSDYECIYSLAKMNDSHVYACDHSSATYNVNIKINSSTPPYSGCVNLSNESTYQGLVANTTDGYFINKNATLCAETYYRPDTGSAGSIILNASTLTLDCDGATLVGDGTNYGFFITNGEEDITIRNCNVSSFNFGVNFNTFGSERNVSIINTNSWNCTSRGIFLGGFYDSRINNCNSFDQKSFGFYISSIDNLTISDSSAWNTSSEGFYILSSENLSMYDLSANNITDRGIFISNSHNFTLDGAVTGNNSQQSVQCSASDDVYMNDIIASDNPGQSGVYIFNCDRGYFSNILAENNRYGVLLGGTSVDNVIFNMTVQSNTEDGFYLTANNNNITNSTFSNNDIGARVWSGATNNHFYFNSFLSNTQYHVWSDTAGNHYNTTNTGKAAGYQAEGNYWDDILTLDILDLNGDGFGDIGTDYPYNAANGGNVSTNVQDEGPITTKGCTDNDADGFYAITASPACPGTYRDCDDNNANILPPYDGLTPTVDTILCNGTYYINDSGANGVITFGADDISITGNNTHIIGNLSGWAFSSDARSGISLIGCNTTGYQRGVYLLDSPGSTLINITVKNNTDQGIFLDNSDYSWIESVNSSNNTFDGVNIFASSFTNITRSSAYENGRYGFNLGDGSGYSTVNFSSAWDNDRGFVSGVHSNILFDNLESWNNDIGISLTSSDYTDVFDCDVWNSTTGIRVSADNYNISGCSISDSTGFGIYLNDDVGHVHDNYVENVSRGIYLLDVNWVNFTNNSLFDVDYGVYLGGLSTGNMFYFNEFRSSAYAHAYSSIIGNHFNTTYNNGTHDVAAGNYWDDILSLDIYDWDADGFGNAGTEYPYSNANNGNVSTNIEDYGPITTKGPPGPPAEAAMVIFGPNGTVETNTRNVHLNITFGSGVLCRWANDAEANLALYPWENCTTVKPWILSESEGNKTVYMEVRQAGGSTNIFNDSILYKFMQDYTPPTAPVVYDGDSGIDINWWNSNTTVAAYWWNATDDISTIYYRYRLLNDSDYYAGSPAWTDANTQDSITMTGLSLTEGWNMSFEVQAYNSDGWNSSIANSNGSIIDLTKPDKPIINSTTNPLQTISYDSSTIKFNFTSTDPVSNSVASGIEGYSYTLDTHPGTAPDNNMEARFWESLHASRNDGTAQLLRQNSSGLLFHSVYSQIKENFTAGEDIKIRVALAEDSYDTDDGMNIKAYLMSTGGDGNPVINFNSEADAISTISNVTRDIRYSESMGSATVYEFGVEITSTTSDVGDDIYVVVTGVSSDNDNRNNLSIAASSTPDNTTDSYVCNGLMGGCTDTTQTTDFAISVTREDSGSAWSTQYDNIGDGTYYFHVKAKDRAGNWGDTSHYKVIVDTAGVAIDIKSPFTGQLFTNSSVEVVTEVNEYANVSVIVLHEDGSNDTTPWYNFTSTFTFNVTIENGSNEIYAIANNTANGVITRSQSVYVRFSTDLPESNKTLRIDYGGGLVCAGHVCDANEGGAVGMTLGIATENDAASIVGGEITADTSRQSIKIFATDPSGIPSSVEDDLDDDDFLDRVNPMFGYDKSAVPYYIIRAETRPISAYLEGDRKLGSGKYTIVFKNVGVTPDGKTNVSVRIV